MSGVKSATATIETRVRRACYLALAALGLIAWSLVDPAPLPVVGAMSVGQLLGTLSLLFFVVSIVADVRRTLARVHLGTAAPKEEEAATASPPPRRP